MVGYAPTEQASRVEDAKEDFWRNLLVSIDLHRDTDRYPPGSIFVLVDSNAHTGTRGHGGGGHGSKVLGPCGRDILINDNDWFAGDYC